MGPVLGPGWVRGCFAGFACRIIAGFWYVGRCRGALESVAVCGRVSKEGDADPVRTQGGPSPDPVKRGAGFGTSACDCLPHIWRGSGGVFLGAVLGGFRGSFSGWFWGGFSGVFWRSISGGFVSPFRTEKSDAAARDRVRVRRGDL